MKRIWASLSHLIRDGIQINFGSWSDWRVGAQMPWESNAKLELPILEDVTILCFVGQKVQI